MCVTKLSRRFITNYYSIRDKNMAYKNIELRQQRGRERYARDREARKQAVREYYERNKETLREKRRKNHAKYAKKRKEYYEAHKEKKLERSRAYYYEHKEEMAAYAASYREEHRERLTTMRHQAKSELYNARNMCPAFKFVDKIRLANIELYTTKYRPGSNLAHKAAKQCPAIISGDYTQCPICKDCSQSGTEMARKCPMPHVFEFENAVSEIRSHAADIVLSNQK